MIIGQRKGVFINLRRGAAASGVMLAEVKIQGVSVALIDLCCKVANFLEIGVVEQLGKEGGFHFRHLVSNRLWDATNSFLILTAHLDADL